jgi:predicted acyltransferase
VYLDGELRFRFRFPNRILQRIGVCYLVEANLYLMLRHSWHHRVLVLLSLGIYLSVMYGIPAGSCGQGNLSSTCNGAFWLDQQVIGSRYLYRHGQETDPEGLLSTLTSLFTAHLGLEAGRIYNTHIRRTKGAASSRLQPAVDRGEAPTASRLAPLRERQMHILIRWLIWGVLFSAGGLLVNVWEPLNKKLWSISFAMLTGGSGMVALGNQPILTVLPFVFFV